jgi:hypothetical protein
MGETGSHLKQCRMDIPIGSRVKFKTSSHGNANRFVKNNIDFEKILI